MAATGKLAAVTVAGILLTSTTSLFPQNWRLTSAPITNWSSIAMSADGRKLVAAGGSSIYVSTNFGVTWNPATPDTQDWSAAASSADGMKLAAVAPKINYSGGIWTSTNSGTTWAQTSAPTTNNWWDCIVSSADGSRLVAIDHGFYHYPPEIFASTNYSAVWGMTFMVNAGGPEYWTSLSTSADGTKGMAASTVFIYASGDSGLTWATTGAPAHWVNGNTWSGLGCSSDGSKSAAVTRGGEVHLSTNAGVTWTIASAPSFSWSAVASSTDGSILAVVSDSGPIYISTNSGAAWSATSAPNLAWVSVVSSADGCKLAAVVNGGGIYTWQTTPTPVLNITPTDGGFVISWIVPAMPFVLQENSDLTTTNWTDVITTPILNLTNLHHEVSVPLSSTNRFYRLQSL